jgi:TetR/AcrR family tetracycline transcriptional repressor
MNEERWQKHLERLETRRRQVNERMDHINDRLEERRARINEHFDQKAAHLGGKLNLRQEQIIEAALALLSEEGLNNLSLRDIAKRINVQAPAIYWHFKSKEVLIDYMAEAILRKELHTIEVRQDNERWQDWLTDHMIRLRKAMLAYPDGARVVAGAHLFPAVTLGRSFECTLLSLSSAGIDLQDARHIAMTITNYTFGYVIEEQAAPTPDQLNGMDWDAISQIYPTMMQSIRQSGVTSHVGDDKDFVIGLQYIIEGSQRV